MDLPPLGSTDTDKAKAYLKSYEEDEGLTDQQRTNLLLASIAHSLRIISRR